MVVSFCKFSKTPSVFDIFINYFSYLLFSSYTYALISLTNPLSVVYVSIGSGGFFLVLVVRIPDHFWFSPRRPGFDFRYGNTHFKCANFTGVFLISYEALRL